MKRLALFVVAAMAIACGGSTTAPSVITAPAGVVTTETFTGTLNPPATAGAFNVNLHTFTVTTAGGNLDVTLVSAGPPATIQLRLALGNPTATGSCSIIPLQGFDVQTAAGSAAQIPTTEAPAGAYCVGVADIGNVLQPITYTVTVAHT